MSVFPSDIIPVCFPEDRSSMARLKLQYEGVSAPVVKKRSLLDALDFSEV